MLSQAQRSFSHTPNIETSARADPRGGARRPGRALALAVDSSGDGSPRSRSPQSSRPFYRIWHNMLRWLSSDPA